MKRLVILIAALVGVASGVWAAEDQPFGKAPVALYDVRMSELAFVKSCHYLEENVFKKRFENNYYHQKKELQFWEVLQRAMDSFYKRYNPQKARFNVPVRSDWLRRSFRQGAPTSKQDIFSVTCTYGTYLVSRVEFIAWQLFHNPALVKEDIEKIVNKNQEKSAEAHNAVFE